MYHYCLIRQALFNNFLLNKTKQNRVYILLIASKVVNLYYHVWSHHFKLSSISTPHHPLLLECKILIQFLYSILSLKNKHNLTFKNDTEYYHSQTIQSNTDGFLPLPAGERMSEEFDLLNATAIKSFPMPPVKALDKCAYLEWWD